MSPEQEATLFQTIGRIDERTEATSKDIAHLRSDIADLYGENKTDRSDCEKHRAEICKKINTVEEKADADKKWSVEMKLITAGLVVSIGTSVVGVFI